MKKRILIILILIVSSSFIVFSQSSRLLQSLNLNKIQSGHNRLRIIKEYQFSENMKIKSILHQFKRSVRKSNTNDFIELLDESFEDSSGVSQGKSYANQLFIDNIKNNELEDRDPYSNRRKPLKQNIGANWDFELIIKDIDIHKNNRRAQVICEVFYKYDQPDIELEDDYLDFLWGEKELQKKSNDKRNKPKDEAQIAKETHPKIETVTIDLVLKNDEWKIKKIDKFFKFLDKRKNKLRKEKYGLN